MTRDRSVVALATTASAASLVSLAGLVERQAWFGKALVLLVVVALAGVLARRFTARPVLVLVGQLVAVAFVATWQFAGAFTWYGLPTLGVLRRFGVLFTEFGNTVYVTAAPLPLNPGVACVFVLGAALLGCLVDFLAVSRSAPAAAGLPLLTVFLTATANNAAPLPLPYFLLAAGAWLVLLARQAQLGMTRWASTPARPLAPSSSGGLTAPAVTRFGTFARRLGVGSLVVAAIAPSFLPHLPTRYVLDGLARSYDGRGNTRIGYSSSLDVGASLSSGRTDLVLRYRSTAPTAAPLRVLATTAFDGASWSRPQPTLGRSARLDLDSSVPRVERTISVEGFRLDPPALATPQPISAVDLGGVSWQVDESTSDVYVQTRPDSYSTTYLEPTLSAAVLREGVDGRAGPDPLPTSPAIAAALRLDPGSARVTEGAQTPFDRATAIQTWLRSTGGFSYTLTLPPPPEVDGRPADPLSAFLSSKQGYCVQFASAMVMMARASGIPARMAIGFLPGTLQDGVYTVTSADAHSWPELYFPGAGWVRFEPTPATRTGAAPTWTLQPATPLPTSTSAPLPTEVGPGPDRTIDRSPADEATTAEIRQPLLDRIGVWLSDPTHLVLLAVVLGLAGALVLPVTAYLVRRLRRRGGGPPAALVERQWAELTGRLADLGVQPPPGGTLRDWQGHYTRAGYLDASAGEALGHVVATVEAARYARPGTDLDVDLGMPCRRLVHDVSRTRSWRHRVRALLAPGDARAWWAGVGRHALAALATPARWARRAFDRSGQSR